MLGRRSDLDRSTRLALRTRHVFLFRSSSPSRGRKVAPGSSGTLPGTEAMTSSSKRWWFATGAFAIGFVLFTLFVQQQLLNHFDAQVRQFARPNNVWGAAQMRADLVVEGLRPSVLFIWMGLCVVASRILTRSWFPIVAGCGFLLAVSATVLTKLLISRPDPHGYLAPHSGSYPSGHVVTIMVSVGLTVLMISPRASGWVTSISALFAGLLMGTCLLIQSAHWASDVIGGVLLACCILAATQGLMAVPSRVSSGLPHTDVRDATPRGQGKPAANWSIELTP